jgi:hypothetical protein
MQGVPAQLRKFQSKLKPCSMRTLQQAPVTSELEQVADVKTPRDLHEALAAGKRHIVLSEHLDLTTIETLAEPVSKFLIGLNVTSATLSIRVRPSCPR